MDISENRKLFGINLVQVGHFIVACQGPDFSTGVKIKDYAPLIE